MRGFLVRAAVLIVFGLAVGAAWASPPHRPLRVLAQNGPYAARLARVPRFVRTGVPTLLRIAVTQNGVPARLGTAGQVAHIILASADRTDIRHVLGPPEEAPGVYALTHAFSRPGRYGLWVEITSSVAARHGADATLLATTSVLAWGSPQPVAHPPATEPTAVLPDGTTLRLAAEPSPLRAGIPVRLTLSATDRDGAALPILPDAKAALVVIVGPTLELVRHGHADGVENGSVVVETVLPGLGTYALWAEVLLGGPSGFRSADALFLVRVPQPIPG